MDINQNYKKELIESEKEATNRLKNILDFKIPRDFVVFKVKYGGVDLRGRPPFLLLNPKKLKAAIGEFRQFDSYDDILHHQKQIKKYPEYKFELDNKILKIASCEEQVDIYIGYQEGENLNKIIIYDWGENEFYNVESLEILLRDYLVDYDESLF